MKMMINQNVVRTKVKMPEKCSFLLKPMRFKCLHGGRAGLKSWSIARALLLLGTMDKKLFLCTRELQKSIEHSVHKLLSDQIALMDLGYHYTIQKNSIYGANGTRFIFEGLKNNAHNMKSFEGVDIVWLEEAENVSREMWDLLEPTIRKENSEIWVSFNPQFEDDYMYAFFITNPPSNSIVVKTSYKDNPWFPEVSRISMEKMKIENYQKYLHIWQGMCNTEYEEAIIKPEWFDAAIDAHIKLNFDPMGAKVSSYDPADLGDDQVCTNRHGSVIEEVHVWRKEGIDKGINNAFNSAFSYGSNFIVYDDDGIGKAVKVGLDKRITGRNIKVENFNGNAKVKNPHEKYHEFESMQDTFRNLRSQQFWLLADRFEKVYEAVVNKKWTNQDDMISISSKIETLGSIKTDLCSVRRKRASSNSLIQLESKSEIKDRLHRSPNEGDTFMMVFSNSDVQVKARKLNFASGW